MASTVLSRSGSAGPETRQPVLPAVPVVDTHDGEWEPGHGIRLASLSYTGFYRSTNKTPIPAQACWRSLIISMWRYWDLI